MSLLVHILSFDLRRHRWLIAAWIATTALTIAMQIWAPFVLREPRDFEAIDMAITFGWVSQFLLASVLVPLIMHTHPAVGTTGFWMTRPFPPATLAGSKLLLLSVIFIGVPAVCDIVTMLVYRVPAPMLLLASLEAAILRTAVLFPVLVIAVLTRTLARFAAVIGGIVVTAAACVNAWLMWSMFRAQGTETFAVLELSEGVNSWYTPNSAPNPATEIVSALATIVFAAWLIVRQYKTRRTRATVMLTVTAVFAVAAIATLWPWPILQARPQRPAWADDPSAARLVITESVVQLEATPNVAGPSSWRTAKVRGSLEELPDGWVASARVMSALITTSDGERVESGLRGYDTSLWISGAPAQGRVALRTVLDVDSVAGSGFPLENPLVLLIAPASSLLDREFVGGYHGEFAIDAAELSCAAVLPLSARATFQADAFRVSVVGVRRDEEVVNVTYRVSDVSSRFRPHAHDTYDFYLRSRSHRQAIGGQTIVASSIFAPRPTFTGFHLASSLPFYTEMRGTVFSSRYFSNGVSLDESWIRDAELVIVRTRRAATVIRTLDIPQLRFVPSRGR
jgi:hypothetical protein